MKRFLSDAFFLLFIVSVLFVGLLAPQGCVPPKAGEDVKVIRAQQALKAGDEIYQAAMKVYFALPAGSLTAPEIKVFEAVRTGYDPAYKTLDAALDAYKAGKTGDLAGAQAALANLLNQVVGLIAKYGGPTLAPVPSPVPTPQPSPPATRWSPYRFPAEVYA